MPTIEPHYFSGWSTSVWLYPNIVRATIGVMDALNVIMTRRSIRSFTNETVEDDDITSLFKAAMAAPSACNQQPWSFVVIRDKKTLGAIPEFHPFSKMLYEAPLAIVVCASPYDLSNEKCAAYWEQDCAAATQNILLAAHALGLGAVWLGAHPSKHIVEGLRSLLSLPDDVVPFSLVALGHPSVRMPAADRFDNGKIHVEQW